MQEENGTPNWEKMKSSREKVFSLNFSMVLPRLSRAGETGGVF
jgi:hypothetical protein